jgi:hypothetical protein
MPSIIDERSQTNRGMRTASRCRSDTALPLHTPRNPLRPLRKAAAIRTARGTRVRVRSPANARIRFRRYPAEFAAQRDASTETSAVHFRSMLGGCISERRTSVISRSGLHGRATTDPVAATKPRLPAKRARTIDRRIFRSPPHVMGENRFNFRPWAWARAAPPRMSERRRCRSRRRCRRKLR